MMTDLGSSIREYAAFIDEVAIEHRGPLPKVDAESPAPIDEAMPAPVLADVTPIDVVAGEPDAASPRRGRLLLAAAAAVALVVGVIGIVELEGDPAPNVEATSPEADDDTVVEVDSFPERDRAVSEILGWLNGEVSPAEFESLLGVDAIPEVFFTGNEPAFAAGRPFTLERTTMLSDRSETIIEGIAGRHIVVTVDYDGTEVSSVELMPTGVEAGDELAQGVALIDEQLRWLAGEEEFTELDYVRRHVGLGVDSYTNFVAVVEEISAGDPYGTVVYRGFSFDGSGVVVLQRGDGGLLLYGALVEEGRLTSATVERSDG